MRTLLLLAACSASVSGLWAWDSTGHQLVASVAFRSLTPAAKAKLLLLLQQHPKFSCWTSGIPPANKDALLETAMREAAIWPDSIKALTTGSGLPVPHCYTAADQSGPGSYQNDGDRYKADPASVAAAKRNTGYADHLMHKYWHFDDLPLAATEAIAKANPPQDVNVAERITLFRNALQSADNSPKGLALKSYDAVWLIHLVGDAHQPLHCASRYLSATDKGDAGGNLVKITGSAGELHGYWDHLPDRTPQSSLPTPDPAAVKVSDAAKWAQDSFDLGNKSAYVDPVGAGLGPFNLSSKPLYETNALSTASAQVALAGARLADLFNTVLK
jgi:hypothetical protein